MNLRLCLNLSLSLLTVGAILGAQPALAAAKETYAHKMEIGNLLYFNGDLERSIKAFQRAGELNPKAFEPHLNLINLYVQKGGEESLNKAVEECNEVLARKPAHKDVNLILGNLLRTQAGFEKDKDKMNAKLDEAAKAVAKAQELGAPEALCENTIGLTLLQRGDAKGALEHIDKAIKKQPIFPDAHLVRAVLLFKNINSDPDPNALTEKLKTAEHQAKLKEVLDELDLAAKQKDKNAEAHNTKADILFAASKHDDALTHYQKATEHEPRYVQAWAGLGNTHATIAGKETDSAKKEHHIKQAKEAYQKAKKLKPDDKNIVYGLAVMLEKQGAVQEAVLEFQEGLMLENDPVMRAQIIQHVQQLQGTSGFGGFNIGGIGSQGMGIGNNIFTSGALSQPFSKLIQPKAPKDKE